MNKIESFTIDHTKLKKGIYVSRKDKINDCTITTFDIRMKQPNIEPVMNTSEIHTIEHLGATFLRNHEIYKESIIYFGPMGCRTGFYLIINVDCSSHNILPLIKELYHFIVNFNGKIPGSSPVECGNFLDMNLNMAKYEANEFLHVINSISKENLVYPE
ncbi:MAG: S-ribosylhomocysteine lyase [Eubacteriaceae bacterium]